MGRYPRWAFKHRQSQVNLPPAAVDSRYDPLSLIRTRETPMPVLNRRGTYFPYCLQRLDDGSWIVLNRNYEPLGSPSKERVATKTSPRHFVSPASLQPRVGNHRVQAGILALVSRDPSSSSPGMGMSQLEALQRLPHGTHVCPIYHHDGERVTTAAAFRGVGSGAPAA